MTVPLVRYTPTGDRILAWDPLPSFMLKSPEVRLIDPRKRSVTPLPFVRGLLPAALSRIGPCSKDGLGILVPREETAVLLSWEGSVRTEYRCDGDPPGRVRAAVFSPSNEFVLTNHTDGPWRLWTSDGRAVAEFEGAHSLRGSVSFSPREDVIAFADGVTGYRVRLYDRRGSALSRLEHEWAGPLTRVVPLTLVRFSPIGDRLLTLDVDVRTFVFRYAERYLLEAARIRLWDVSDPRNPHLLWNRPGNLSADFAPAGDRILTPVPGNRAAILDLDGNEIASLDGHQDSVLFAVFSPTGDHVATASVDGTVRLWGSDGTPLRVLRGHDGPATWLDFSPDGRRLASVGIDRSVREWLVYGEDLLALADERILREFTPEERRRYADLLDDPAGR